MKKYLLNPVSMAVSGLLLGFVSRLLDIYTQNLANIFSELSVWILLGVLISVFSDTRKAAMMNIFPFCVGMLITYYLTAVLTKGVYNMSFIIGWTVFSLFCPIFAFFTWMTKEKGVWPKIISAGILAATLLASVVLFDGPRIYDIVILLLLAYLLFAAKIRRPGRG